MNLRTSCLGLFALVCACASAPWKQDRPRVDDSLLAYVPEEQQGEITEARTRVLELRDQLAAAEADQREADRLLEISRRNVETLQARASTAEARIEHAREHRTFQEVEAARQEANEIDNAVRFAAEQARYQEDLATLAAERKDLIEARIALAEAKVELAKARAVSGLDRPAAADVEVYDHQRAVAELARAVERARIDALVARQRVDLQMAFVEEGRDAVPEGLRLQRVQPLENVFEARAFERQEWDVAVDYRTTEPAVGERRDDRVGSNERERAGRG